jgi:hypothetical protein
MIVNVAVVTDLKARSQYIANCGVAIGTDGVLNLEFCQNRGNPCHDWSIKVSQIKAVLLRLCISPGQGHYLFVRPEEQLHQSRRSDQ